jgi:hypothetical protein
MSIEKWQKDKLICKYMGYVRLPYPVLWTEIIPIWKKVASDLNKSPDLKYSGDLMIDFYNCVDNGDSRNAIEVIYNAINHINITNK